METQYTFNVFFENGRSVFSYAHSITDACKTALSFSNEYKTPIEKLIIFDALDHSISRIFNERNYNN